MVMQNCSSNYSNPPACFDLENATVLSVLHATVPNCQSGHWQPLTPEWIALFYTHVVLFGSLFLLLALGCLIFLCKYHTIMRLRRTWTFIAVDVALMILGFSRVFFYALDPFGISGYCDAFACVVVSRLLSSLTFPSLTASYTLVFTTLWHVSTVKLRRSRVQRWRIIVPLCFVHYFVAVAVELICAFSTYSAIFLLLACEFTFTIWGLLVCSTFLIVGLKILKSVRVTALESSIIRRDVTLTRIPPMQDGKLSINRIDTRILDSANNRPVDSAIVVIQSAAGCSESPTDQSITRPISPGSKTYPTSHDATSSSVSGKKKILRAPRRSKMKQFMLKHHEQAIRKVSIITYAVAVLGVLYSLLGLAQLIMLVMTLFGPCPEDESPTGGNPYMWLTFKYVSSFMELLLACLLVYAVNEIRPVFRLIRNIACSILQCRNVSNVTTNQQPSCNGRDLIQPPHPLESQRQGTLQAVSDSSAEAALLDKKRMQSAEMPGTIDLNKGDKDIDGGTSNPSEV